MEILDLICKELGVDVGEIWLGSDGNYYQIDEDGLLLCCYTDKMAPWEAAYEEMPWLLSGILKPKWMPEKGETYYVPDPVYLDESDRYEWLTWDGSAYDKWCLENNLVFKTEEEAIEAANKMLKALRKE